MKLNGVTQLANEKLLVLGDLAREEAALYADFEKRSAELLREHEHKLGMVRAVYDSTEAGLLQMIRERKAEFFPQGTDQVDLPAGVLLHGYGDHVVIPRNALQAIKDAGYADEAIKTDEYVDRAVVATWSDVKLAAIGAQRKPVEKFEYELKGIEQPKKTAKKKNKAAKVA